METTLNLHNSILEKLARAASIKRISRSEMIILLLKNAMNEIPDPGRLGMMVRYQKKSRPEDWHRFHLRLRMDEYEFFLDLRKLLKMSVSLILAYAVNKFLNSILKNNITDNNRYKNYIIIKEYIDSIICWKFIWGYPRNIEKYIFPDNPADQPGCPLPD